MLRAIALLVGGVLLISLFTLVSISHAGTDSASIDTGQAPRIYDSPQIDKPDQQAAGTAVAADAYRISVREDGIYQMTYADLQAAGLPVDTLNPQSLRLFWMGEEVAIQVVVVGEGDGRFDPGEAVIFYGQSIGSLYRDGRLPTQKYTDTNTYWLTFNATGGKPMAIKDGALTGAAAGPFRHQVHLEQDQLYMPAWPRSTSTSPLRS